MIPVGRFLRALLDQMALPYLWDGKGLAGEAYKGRDCSGAVTAALFSAGGPDLRGSHNAQKMFDNFEPTAGPAPGVLCLYGKAGQIWHVMTYLAAGVVVGAAGGDHTTTSLQEALRRGASVQAWESHLFMHDFAGFRRIPYIEK